VAVVILITNYTIITNKLHTYRHDTYICNTKKICENSNYSSS